MKKILLTSNLYKPNIGGIENSLFYLSEEYKNQEFEVHLVASKINNFDINYLPDFEEINGVKIYRYNGNSLVSRFLNGTKLYRKLLKENKYEKIISRTQLPVLMLKIAGAKKIAYILAGVTCKQNAVNSSKYGRQYIKRLVPNMIHHYIQYVALRLANENYVFSENMVKQVRDYLGYRNIKVIKPGVDAKVFSVPSIDESRHLRSLYGYNDNDIVLIGVGRFYDVKGFEYLIESLVYLPENFKLLLVGDGGNKRKYIEIIKANNLNDRVQIIGPVEDTSNYYKIADLYVLSSLHETLGQTVLEALFSGLPIVAFDDSLNNILTSTREITSDDNRVFAMSVSGEGLAKAIIEAQKFLKEKQKNKECIAKRSTFKFSWEKMIKDIDS